MSNQNADNKIDGPDRKRRRVDTNARTLAELKMRISSSYDRQIRDFDLMREMCTEEANKVISELEKSRNKALALLDGCKSEGDAAALLKQFDVVQLDHQKYASSFSIKRPDSLFVHSSSYIVDDFCAVKENIINKDFKPFINWTIMYNGRVENCFRDLPAPKIKRRSLAKTTRDSNSKDDNSDDEDEYEYFNYDEFIFSDHKTRLEQTHFASDSPILNRFSDILYKSSAEYDIVSFILTNFYPQKNISEDSLLEVDHELITHLKADSRVELLWIHPIIFSRATFKSYDRETRVTIYGLKDNKIHATKSNLIISSIGSAKQIHSCGAVDYNNAPGTEDYFMATICSVKFKQTK